MINKDNEMKVAILGGGQLGKMLIPPAQELGIDIHFLDKADAVCRTYNTNFKIGNLQSKKDIIKFTENIKNVSIEIENINCDALYFLESIGKIVRPSAKVLELIQDKLSQKKFYKKNNFPTAEFYEINKESEIKNLNLTYPLIKKIKKSGFDGRGVFEISSIHELSNIKNYDFYLEKKIKFKKELAVMVVRDLKGKIVSYPSVEMKFNKAKKILETVMSPSLINEKLEKEVVEISKEIASKLKIVGLLAVEFFLDENNNPLINEVSPRPHNSAHHTIEQFSISQFEMMLRTLLCIPIFEPRKYTKCSSMVNIFMKNKLNNIKKLNIFFNNLLKIKDLHLHWYGKKDFIPFRKLGHVTILSDSYKELLIKTKIVEKELVNLSN